MTRGLETTGEGDGPLHHGIVNAGEMVFSSLRLR